MPHRNAFATRIGQAVFAALLMVGLLAGAAAAGVRWRELVDTSFQHLTQDQGLPNEIATALAEDGDGFLWVGTLGGLARWDGYHFRVYRSDPRSAGALPDNVVQTLHGDAAGRLWIGTSAAGIVRYDRDHDRFVSYPVGANGLSHVSVKSIVDDGAGGLWVGTEGGLDHLDPASGAIRHAPPVTDGADGGAAEGVNVLLLDHRGVLWAGTQHGLFRRDASAQRFVRVALLRGFAGADAQPQALCEDSAGRVWVGTQQHGAFVLDGGGAAARAVTETGTAAGPPLPGQQVAAIAEARDGEMWLATASQGIVAVERAGGETRRIRNAPTLPLSLADNALRGIYRDRSGLVWVASNHGLSRHDPRQSAVLTLFGGPAADGTARVGTEVSWILPAADGRIWLGTHKSGVDIIDPAGGPVGALRPDAAHPASALPEDIVLALERAHDGSVFIGTKRGLYRASADGRRVSRVVLKGRDRNASTWALLAEGDTLWIGGQNDGLWRLDLRSGVARPMLRERGQRLSDERIIVIKRDGANLWIGTRYGLNRFDPVHGRVQRIVPEPAAETGLSAAFITTLFFDHTQRLWVGTYGGGINILEGSAAAPRWRHLNHARGLPDDNVNAILEDGDGRLWASTDNGLAMIDGTSLAVRPLRRAEGVVLPTYWTGSAARTAEGELLFGGAGGMTIVRPQRLRTWDYRPAVVVTEIQVGGKRVPRAAGTPLVLTAEANSLTVEFSAVDYSAPERNRYAFRLDGFDTDWIETDASRRLAAYTNLPPGDYKLLLRGSNRDGAWSDKPLALPLRVLPAWHQTLWVRIAAALGVLVLVLSTVSWRTRSLRARQAELQRKVSERTAELEAMSNTLAEKSRILERMSITDPLTGLHNRRFLTEHIDGEIAASLRRAAENAVPEGAAADTDNVFFLIDIDHFKRVNDRHGHAAGDEVLVQFGRRLQAELRASDHLVRWGGEEFLAVARDTDRQRAEEMAERVRVAVSATPFVTEDGRSLNVTCSIGFACAPFLRSDPRLLGWPDVVQIADIALLAAKRAGRDAWVGLHAGSVADRDALIERVHAAPQQLVRSGELRLTSSKPAAAVIEALTARDAAAARAEAAPSDAG